MRANKGALGIWLHRLAKAYSLRPSEILFPSVQNAFWKLAVDNLVFQIGDTEDQKAKMEFEQAKIEHYTKLLTLAFEALVKMSR